MVKAMDKIIAKGKKIAAHLMEASVDDIEFKDGKFSRRRHRQVEGAGRDRARRLRAAQLPDRGARARPGGDRVLRPEELHLPGGCHICEVEIDPETGVVEVVNFTAVDDVGRVINPMIVEGQVQGGVAQGIGQALLENAVYDASGQLLSGSCMDYTMPRADDLPNFKVGTEVTLCTHNPLGVKGCGEVGAIGSPPAVINAVLDALKDYGVRHIDMPATPQKLWSIIQAGHHGWPPNNRERGSRTMYDFAYQKPSSLADAVKALGADPEAQGARRRHDADPGAEAAAEQAERWSWIWRSSDWPASRVDGNTIIIGGMTTHAAVAADADVKGDIPALAELAAHIGDDAVRNRGTIGGSLANNDPAADYPAAVLALGATIKTDRRSIKADDFFQGMFATALEQGELITAVEFPAPEKAAYEKFRNPASRYAIVGVFVAKTAGGVRVAVTGAGQNGVFRHTAMEQALSANFSPDAIASIATPPDGMNSDIHASAEYRAHLVGVMAKRAVARAL